MAHDCSGSPRDSCTCAISVQVLKKGPWTAAEDMKLVEYVTNYGPINWNSVHETTGLPRSGKSCRLRWANHLRPNLKNGPFSTEEQNDIVSLHETLGNKWALIAAQFPGRTDNEIKNFWNTRLKRCIRDNLPIYGDQEMHKRKQLHNSSRPSSSSLLSSSLSGSVLHNPQENQFEHSQGNINGNLAFPFAASNLTHNSTPIPDKESFFNQGLPDSSGNLSAFLRTCPDFVKNSYSEIGASGDMMSGFSSYNNNNNGGIVEEILGDMHEKEGFISGQGSATFGNNDEGKYREVPMEGIDEELWRLLDNPMTIPIPEWSDLNSYGTSSGHDGI